MKKFNLLWLAPLMALILFIQCGSGSPNSTAAFVIEGTIENAANLTATLTLPKVKNQNQIVAKNTLDEKGNFQLEVENDFRAGIYEFSIGQQSTYLIFNGEESKVTINGNLGDLQNYTFSIEGAPATSLLIEKLDMVRQGQMNINAVKNYATEAEYPLTGLYLAMMVTRGNATYLETYEKAIERVKTAHGADNPTYQTYAGVIQNLKERNKEKIAVGDEAPNIAMEGPQGKVYELEDLEGKVVLLDFWASWCRPCRIANPHVVEMYDKYKEKGFTVFSVSLDGIDQRTAAKIGNNPETIERYKEQQKDRWVQAIEQDNLKWDYHVSDLKKWDSDAAELYGVRSIPRTFLIDREGKIAAVNPRNNLEEELQKLLGN